MTVEVGATVKGVVVKVADYGAIVRLPQGKMGLVHISEIADTYVRDVREFLGENDEITVRVLRLTNKGRFELTMKQCDAKPADQEARPELAGVGAARYPRAPGGRPDDAPMPTRPPSFEDRLSRFMKDSEERQHDLKRHLETKRGHR